MRFLVGGVSKMFLWVLEAHGMLLRKTFEVLWVLEADGMLMRAFELLRVLEAVEGI